MSYCDTNIILRYLLADNDVLRHEKKLISAYAQKGLLKYLEPVG
jgi:predicted nucleic-acid-binding protein